MLVNLTPNLLEIKRRLEIAKKNEFTYNPQNTMLLETGVYQDNLDFIFSKEDFQEDLISDNFCETVLYEKDKRVNETILQYFKRTHKTWFNQEGVADNIEQIKKYNCVISVTPVYQDKSNEGKGGGWRWHKWGKYIGKLNHQYEYLDDEDFGDDDADASLRNFRPSGTWSAISFPVTAEQFILDLD